MGAKVLDFRAKVVSDARRHVVPKPSAHERKTLQRGLRAKAKATRRCYRSAFKKVDWWRAKTGRADAPVTDEVLAEFLLYLHREERKAPSTLRMMAQSIRWRERQLDRPDPKGKETSDILAYARREGSNRLRGPAKGLTLDQVTAMIETAERCGNLTGLRDAAILSCMFYSGLRRSEAAALRVSDFRPMDNGGATLFIAQSKTDQGGRGAVVPLPSEGVPRVRAWIEASGLTDGPLFRSVRQYAYKPVLIGKTALCSDSVGTIVRLRAAAAGIKGVTSHSLRRSFAQALTLAGLPIQEVANAGRWSQVDTVLLYTRNERAARSSVAGAFAKLRGGKKWHT